MAKIFEFSPNVTDSGGDAELSSTDICGIPLKEAVEYNKISVPGVVVRDYIRQLMIFDRGNDSAFQDWLDANSGKFNDTDIAELKGWNNGIRFAINQAKEMLLGVVETGEVSFDE